MIWVVIIVNRFLNLEIWRQIRIILLDIFNIMLPDLKCVPKVGTYFSWFIWLWSVKWCFWSWRLCYLMYLWGVNILRLERFNVLPSIYNLTREYLDAYNDPWNYTFLGICRIWIALFHSVSGVLRIQSKYEWRFHPPPHRICTIFY